MSYEPPRWPARESAGHKGTFGTVCVIGGQAEPPRVMIGGPAFSAAAALRAGAGLAVLAVPQPIMTAALVIAPGATGLALPVASNRALDPSGAARILDEFQGTYDCIAIGPGWGAGPSQQQILIRLLADGETPMVVDADALNALAAMPDFARDLRAPCVLTPHPGEYARLAQALALDADPVDPTKRQDAARQLAARLGCVVVLKGAGTVVSDGQTTAVATVGNVALATAGTGDVLTGIIASLVAQHFRSYGGAASLSLLDCAWLGVNLHGRAADRWAARHGNAGLAAMDLVEELPDAMVEMRG